MIAQRALPQGANQVSQEQGPPNPINTFIIRFWREVGTTRARWRGRVQHVQSGEHVAFVDEDSLLAFLRRWVRMPEEIEGAKE